MNNLKSKKLIAMTLTFMLVMVLAGLPLPAKERRGSMVEVTLTDGSQVKGELLAVKGDTLLVIDRDTGQGMNFGLEQVAQVKILEKTKFFLTGLAIGLGVGLVVGSAENIVHINYYRLKTCFSFALIGGLLNALANSEKKFTLADLPLQIRLKKLEWLKRYARER